MKHDTKFEEMIMLYHFEELSETERNFFEEHLAECSHCQSELTKLKEFDSILSQTQVEKPSEELIDRMNMQVMSKISIAQKTKFITQIKNGLYDLFDSIAMLFTRPKYQFAGMGFALVMGILIGKLWLSAGLRQDPNMFINIVNNISSMSNEQKESFQKAFASYMLQSGDIEVADLIRGGEVRSGEEGIVEVGFKVNKDFALKGGVDDPTIQGMLRYSALHDKSPERRLHAIKLLANSLQCLEIESTMSAVLLHDRDEMVRRKALEVLETYTVCEETIEAYKSVVLHDPAPEIRKTAIERLYEVGTEDIISVIVLAAIKDTNPAVASYAEEVVGKLNDKTPNEN